MTRKFTSKRILSLFLVLVFVVALLPVAQADEPTKYSVEHMSTMTNIGTTQDPDMFDADDFYRITQPAGGPLEDAPVLSIANTEWIIDVTIDGYTYAFKDLNRNGALDTYEDWRLPLEERASNLVDLLTVDSPINNIAGLMHHSIHQRTVGVNRGNTEATAHMRGWPTITANSGSTATQLEDGVRFYLQSASGSTTANQVMWLNAMQRYAENSSDITGATDMLGIPMNISSDPRNGSGTGNGRPETAVGSISRWPNAIGMAATFDPSINEQFGMMSSQEYRALGISTALSPQIDVATDPRWGRFSGTYGESPQLGGDMALAYVTGFQSDYARPAGTLYGTDMSTNLGWGKDGVAAMMKHWPGDAPAEGGRESHSADGKYSVFPGDNFKVHAYPFAQAMQKENVGTSAYAAAVMPSYSISIGSDGKPLGGDAMQMASAASVYKSNLLFDSYGFTGYSTTDWEIMGTFTNGGTSATNTIPYKYTRPVSVGANHPEEIIVAGTTNVSGRYTYGIGHFPPVERTWAVYHSGQQFGGGYTIPIVIAAYYVAVNGAYNAPGGSTDRADIEKAYAGMPHLIDGIGKEAADALFKDHAYRVLLSSFQLGLFENPYRSVKESEQIVGNLDFHKAGYEAQQKSVIMLKNQGNVIKDRTAETTKPTVYIPRSNATSLRITESVASEYFNVVTDVSATQRRTNAELKALGVDFVLTQAASARSHTGNGTISTGSGSVINLPGIPDIEAMLKKEERIDINQTIYDYMPDFVLPSHTSINFDNFDWTKPISTGFIPRSLQYSSYTANPEHLRNPLAQDPFEEAYWDLLKEWYNHGYIENPLFENFPHDLFDSNPPPFQGNKGYSFRYYGGQTSNRTANNNELAHILEIADIADDIPMVLYIQASNPMVFSEFEDKVDAIVQGYGVSYYAALDVISGKYEPSGLLPAQQPKNMETVERQFEDTPFDMECHVDAAGNTYDFAFGLNWSGVISDARTAQYTKNFVVPEVPTGPDPNKYSTEYMDSTNDNFYRITQPAGGPLADAPVLSIANIEWIIDVKVGDYTYAFKDLNRNGALDTYEDWRLSLEARAEDLTDRLTDKDPVTGERRNPINKTAPLAGHSSHQSNFAVNASGYPTTQLNMLRDGTRWYLNAGSSNTTAIQTTWNNAMQRYAEEAVDISGANDMLGIPVNISSDPRSSASAGTAWYEETVNTTTSRWPGSLGLAATFDPKVTEQFGMMVAQEYRAMGITTALSPQIDTATEPRWGRVSGTFGEGPQLSGAMALAYTTGFQSSYAKAATDNKLWGTSISNNLGWGTDGVAAMMKHWPGDGSAEAGRESHQADGKYNVSPNDNFKVQVWPFAASMQKENVGTPLYATATMPSYSINVGSDGKPLGGDSMQASSANSPYKMRTLLKDYFGFTGYNTTDWGILGSAGSGMQITYTYPDYPDIQFNHGPAGIGRTGVGHFPMGERVWMFLYGTDQFGGNTTINNVKAAYYVAANGAQFAPAKPGDTVPRTSREDIEEGYAGLPFIIDGLGKQAADEHFADIAYRCLLSSFQLGIFENPYRSVAESVKIVGNLDFNKAGYEAQLKSVVMLKNKGNVIKDRTEETTKPTIYIPRTSATAGRVNLTAAAKYFNVITDDVSGTSVVRKTNAELVAAGVDFVLTQAATARTHTSNATIGTGGTTVNLPNLATIRARFAELGLNETEVEAKMAGILMPTHATIGTYSASAPINSGWGPRSLQYGPYTANPDHVRNNLAQDPGEEAYWELLQESVGETPLFPNFPDHAKGKSFRWHGGNSSNRTANNDELTHINEIAAISGSIPMVLYIQGSNPMIFSEFEDKINSIVIGYGVSDYAILEVVAGKYQPNGLLPLQQPKNMETVEKQFEDTPYDMECYVDEMGSVYDYAFGLNWSGVINDDRVTKYGDKTWEIPLPDLPIHADTIKYSAEYNESDDFWTITNPNDGAKLSVANIDIIIEVVEDGYTYAFKDLDNDDSLDLFEDWRESAEDRADALADALTASSPIDSIAPLMLASSHQSVPLLPPNNTPWVNLTQQGLLNNGIRHILNADNNASTINTARWTNALQRHVETNATARNATGGVVIPVNLFSDPRSNAGATDGFYDGSSSAVSKWPGALGFGATFDPLLTELFGNVASQEYRALGINTALSPQIDLATEPRWNRVSGTYGESPELTADIAAAYTKGFQSTVSGSDLIWGADSVAAMLKHFPGDGPGEGGRESHSTTGMFSVYPGGNFAEHLLPFQRALDTSNLNTTLYAAAVMPSYSIGVNADGTPLGTDSMQLGSAVSPYRIRETLYDDMQFDGYVCTDWGIAGTITNGSQLSYGNVNLNDAGGGTAWGTGNFPAGERIWAGLSVGTDMYGMLENPNAIKAAYWVAVNGAKYGANRSESDLSLYNNLPLVQDGIGQEAADAHFKDSARRILLSSFRLGLFEDPYIDVVEADAIVGSAEFNNQGYEVQLKSVVMLKNKGDIIAPSSSKKTVYIPLTGSGNNIAGVIDITAAERQFNVVTDSISGSGASASIVRRTDFTGVDFTLIKVNSPTNSGSNFAGTGWDIDLRNIPGDVAVSGFFGPVVPVYNPSQPIHNGFMPRTLQYGSYTADPAFVRQAPIGLDPDEEARWQAAVANDALTFHADTDRTKNSRYYGGKTVQATNGAEMLARIDLAVATGKPVVVAVAADNAMIFNEFENRVDGIVMGFGVSDNALVDIVAGVQEPSGLLPMQMPKNMATVETQLEDVPFDMECHVDTEGNVYNFAYGLNWSGVISDWRTEKYGVETPEQAERTAGIVAPSLINTDEDTGLSYSIELKNVATNYIEIKAQFDKDNLTYAETVLNIPSSLNPQYYTQPTYDPETGEFKVVIWLLKQGALFSADDFEKVVTVNFVLKDSATYPSTIAGELTEVVVNERETGESTFERFRALLNPNKAITTITNNQLRFDTNEDGIIDIDDVMNVVYDYYLFMYRDENWHLASRFDANKDGIINIADILIIITFFTPEPFGILETMDDPDPIETPEVIDDPDPIEIPEDIDDPDPIEIPEEIEIPDPVLVP